MKRPGSQATFAICGAVTCLWSFSALCGAESEVTACGLLSRAEMERALHAPVRDSGVRVNTESVSTCMFRAGRIATPSVLLRRKASPDWIAEQKKRMGGPGSFRPLAGVGDSAFVLDRGEEGAALCVFRGITYLQISLFRLGSAETVLPALEELARKALARLAAASPGKA